MRNKREGGEVLNKAAPPLYPHSASKYMKTSLDNILYKGVGGGGQKTLVSIPIMF